MKILNQAAGFGFCTPDFYLKERLVPYCFLINIINYNKYHIISTENQI